MNQSKNDDGLLFETSFALSWIKVYRDRVVFNEAQKMFGFLSSTTVPIAQISDVSTNALLAQITILTTGGKQYKITTNKKSQVKKAIEDAQISLGGKSTSQANSTDELVKLNELRKDGVITQEEFDKKKKQLLGI